MGTAPDHPLIPTLTARAPLTHHASAGPLPCTLASPYFPTHPGPGHSLRGTMPRASTLPDSPPLLLSVLFYLHRTPVSELVPSVRVAEGERQSAALPAATVGAAVPAAGLCAIKTGHLDVGLRGGAHPPEAQG